MALDSHGTNDPTNYSPNGPNDDPPANAREHTDQQAGRQAGQHTGSRPVESADSSALQHNAPGEAPNKALDDAARSQRSPDERGSRRSDESDEGQQADETPTKPPRKPPAAGRGTKAPAHVIQLRVATIARALVDGLGRAAILQAIAKAQVEEAARRVKARNAISARSPSARIDPVELTALVPFVWGDEPVPERTIDFYIARAKATLADEGLRVVQHREYVLALNLARLNETYKAAFEAKRFHTCVTVVKEINAMFGMSEAIRTMLVAEARAQSDAEMPSSLHNDETKASVMVALIKKASVRDPSLHDVFARFAELSSAAKLATHATHAATVDRNAAHSTKAKGVQ
jgi:hypothetical protein